jgi:Secretion system C-terminal sorting domain/Beta-propeller repeat
MNKCIPVFMFSLFCLMNANAQNFPGGGIKKQPKPTLYKTHYSGIFKSQSLLDSAQMAWIEVYNDPINGDDEAQAMAKDDNDNIYVTGNTSDWDITTIKYNSEGVQQWINIFDGPGHGDDVPYDLKVDHNGNVYIAGYSDENGEYNYNFLTMKIDSTGNLAWANLIINLPGPNNDVAFSVVVDDSGNVYSTGATFVNVDFDLTTVKYNSEGQQLWLQKYNSPFNYEDTGLDLVLDSNHNIYITGLSQQIPGNYDAITLKYNTNGVMQWLKRYDGPADENDGGLKLALDADSDVIITGYQTGNGTLFDMLTIKYDNNGNQLWASSFNGPANSEDASNDLALDTAGNIYITGYATGPNNTSDYATLKYNSSGVQQWVSYYTGPANGFEQAYGIALDNTNGVYVTGYSPSVITPFVHYEYATIKYDTSGQEQWTARYGGNSSLLYEPNVAQAVVVDNSDNVYITGELADEGTGEDFGTIKYSQNITPVELTTFTASVIRNNVVLIWKTAAETNNRGFEVQRSDAGGKSWEKIGFVQGNGTTTQPQQYTYTDKNVSSSKYTYRLKQIDFDGTFKYSKEIEVNGNVPLQFALGQNYPNPFNPTTQVEYSIPKEGFVNLTVYNTLGQQVANLVNRNMKAGEYHITFDASNLASGVYFYRLKAGSFIQTKKMILLK